MRGLRRDAALLLVLVIVVVGVGWWTSDHDAQVDLSGTRRFSLSSDTRRLIGAVKAPLHVTVFLNTTGEDAADARFLLDRYHELNHHITYQVADPDEDPSLARRFGITDFSTVVLQYRGHRVDAPDAEELDLSTAILELLEGNPPLLCILTGHGEDDVADRSATGFSDVAQLLQDNDYATQMLDLTTGANPTVPTGCAAVLIDGPRDPLLPAEMQALVAYGQAGGRLLVLATPLSNADPNPLLNPWGIHFVGGLVVDPQHSEGADPSNLIVADFPSFSPVDYSINELQFPASGELATTSDALAGLTVEDLAVTSDGSYVAPDPSVDVGYQSGDRTGSVVVAAAADASRVVPGLAPGVPGPSTPAGSHVVRTRVLATGTDIWATNEFLDNLSNRRFLVNGLAWLTQRDDLVVAADRPDPDRPLAFTGAAQERTIEITVVLIPALILGLGSAPALLRRRRRS